MKRFKKTIVFDCLNCILEFLNFGEQSKYVFSINKVFLNLYTNSYHRVFNCSLSELDSFITTCNNLKPMFEFIDVETILKNVRCITINRAGYIDLKKLNPKKLILKRHFISKFNYNNVNTLEIEYFNTFRVLTIDYPILNIKKLTLLRLQCSNNPYKLQNVTINCEELYIDSSKLNEKFQHLKFNGLLKFTISKCYGDYEFYSKIVEDNSETLECLKIRHFIFLKINKPLKKLKYLEIVYSTLIFPKIEYIETLHVEVNHFFSESKKFVRIKNLSMYFKSWDKNFEATFKNRLNFLKFLKKPTNMTLRTQGDENLYYFFRECVKSSKLRDLKILHQENKTTVDKIKLELKTQKFPKINILLYSLV